MKKYLLFGLLSLMLIVTGCGTKNTVSGVSESNNTVVENQPNFVSTLNVWGDELDEILDIYTDDYPLGDKYQEVNSGNADGLNRHRADWDNFNDGLIWNTSTVEEENILGSVRKVAYYVDKLMEYKSNFFRSGSNEDYDMVDYYEDKYNNELNYYHALVDKYND